MGSPLETAFRRTIDSTFHQAVAFATLSVSGAILSLPVITVGPAVFGVAHGIVTVSRRGSQHGVRESLGLFVEGMRRYLTEGIAVTAFLLVLVFGLVANGFLLATEQRVWLVALVTLSTLLLIGCALVVMHALALVTCGFSPRTALRDGSVLLFRHPGATILQGSVVVSIFVLGHLTLVGWTLIGFAVTDSFVVQATSRLYEGDDGTGPLYG